MNPDDNSKAESDSQRFADALKPAMPAVESDEDCLPRPERARRSLASAERLRALMNQGRTTALSDAPSISADRAEVLISEVAASRRAR